LEAKIMKKRFLGVSLVAAALTMSASMTAFAGWQQDMNGYRYQRADGSYQDWGWFTDPDTGLEYYFDLEGYTMCNTRVEGYWLDADGVKHEKTEEEIAAEKARSEREHNTTSPSKKIREAKEQAAATVAAGDIALSTTRTAYTTEMQVYVNRAFVKIKKALAAEGNTSYVGDVSEDNEQSTYYYDTKDSVRILNATFWKNSTKTSRNYVEYPIEINYNRNIIHGDDTARFDEAFQYMLKAALGETTGTAVYEKVMAIEVGSEEQLNESGTTDTGNTYTLTYRYNNANLKVVCSEIVPASEEDETAAETTETTVVSESSTTSVITAGMSSTDTDQSAVSETETSETETSAEVEADDEDGEE
jgi:hypothetical protein